ncbi:MAG: cellulase family glycosylhydrolase, partial [Sandaracinaceae bacterium]|nr:cellulase family glycosylhydrolase [Sandaracinaceae bacterium]
MLRRLTLCVALASLSSPALADLGDNGVGINAHVPDDAVADLVAAAGVNWIRVDANWFQLQPARDRYDWSAMDGAVERAHARGLSVYMTLAYTPAWVARVPERRADGQTHNDEPAGSGEWAAFVEAAVSRYAARGVTHFGLWNEPNLPQFWDGTADSYVDKIALPGAAAIRRACSTCVVLGPDLAHVGSYDTFLDRVLERASAAFDVLAHHIYNDWPENGRQVWDGDRFLEALEMRRSSFTRASLREVLDRRGWTGEVWITETGFRARPGDAAEEAKQATFVRRALEEQLLRPWWTNTFFYEAVDCRPFQPDCGIDGFGLTRAHTASARAWPADYRAKPAYEELRAFIAAHPELPGEAPPPGTEPPPPPDAGASSPDAGAPRADAGAPPSADAGIAPTPDP